jgi:hypothetical protein
VMRRQRHQRVQVSMVHPAPQLKRSKCVMLWGFAFGGG